MKINPDTICKKITNAYVSLNHSLGWRFINSSKNTLSKNSGIALITLNPGGDKYEKPICSLEENNNAYLDENWTIYAKGQDPLQKQIQYLFQEIHKRTLKYDSSENLIRNSFMAHFVPFRSPNFDSLHSKKESVEFSMSLWKEIINSENFNFSLIICIGKEQFEKFEKIFNTYKNYELIKTEMVPTGWGNYQSIINRYKKDGEIITLVYLQHLSRFRIFNRENGKEQVNLLLNTITEGLK